MEIGAPLRGEAADRIMARIQSRVQSRPDRCEARLFDADDHRCHRDAGHRDAHIHYAEVGDGLAGWRNEDG